MGVNRVNQRQKFARFNRVGAAAAKGNAPHPRAFGKQAGDRGDFLMQRGKVALHPRPLARRPGVATAIIADLFAKRDVEIERDVTIRPGNRAFDRAFGKRAEIRRSGIAGVTRHRLGEQFGMILPHECA